MDASKELLLSIHESLSIITKGNRIKKFPPERQRKTSSWTQHWSVEQATDLHHSKMQKD